MKEAGNEGRGERRGGNRQEREKRGEDERNPQIGDYRYREELDLFIKYRNMDLCLRGWRMRNECVSVCRWMCVSESVCVCRWMCVSESECV